MTNEFFWRLVDEQEYSLDDGVPVANIDSCLQKMYTHCHRSKHRTRFEALCEEIYLFRWQDKTAVEIINRAETLFNM